MKLFQAGTDATYIQKRMGCTTPSISKSFYYKVYFFNQVSIIKWVQLGIQRLFVSIALKLDQSHKKAYLFCLQCFCCTTLNFSLNEQQLQEEATRNYPFLQLTEMLQCGLFLQQCYQLTKIFVFQRLRFACSGSLVNWPFLEILFRYLPRSIQQFQSTVV